MKVKNSLVTILDIGTTKITVMVADISNSNNIKIIANSIQEAKGFKSGIINDLKQAEESILNAISSAEYSLSSPIEKVIVGISCSKLTSTLVNAEVSLSPHPITEKDVAKVNNLAIEQYINSSLEVIHSFPLYYNIDNEIGIKNPISMYGNKLSSTLHLIAAPSNWVLNLANCITRCRLDIQDFIIAPYASAIACLTENEKQIGTILIDIGGYNTSLAIFNEGEIVHVDSISVGGAHITADIAHGLVISLSDAEQLKVLYGNAISTSFDEYNSIELITSDIEKQGNEAISIRNGELCDIIKPRVEEIFELIKQKLEDSDYKSFNKRIVLTGGTSQLSGIKELASHILSTQVRTASPKLLMNLTSEYNDASFASAIGMVEIAANNLSSQPSIVKEEAPNKTSIFKKLFEWI